MLSAETSSSSGLGKEEKPSKYRLIDATKYYIVEEDVSDDEDIDPKHYQTPTYQRSVNCKVSRNSILLHSGLNSAWYFWLSTRFSCLKMKSVENILGYVREQFYRFSRGCKPQENH